MLFFPNNTSARDAIQWHLKNMLPMPQGHKGRSMVLVSGGMDSVALLYAMLQHTDHDIHAHHVQVVNKEHRYAAEWEALQKCLTHLRTYCRPFEFSASKYEMMVGEARWVGPDASLVAFMASRANMAMGSPNDAIWTAHLRGPMFEYMDMGAIFGACHTSQRRKPVLLMPFLNFLKFNLYASMPPELAVLTWSCRHPRYDANGQAQRCGHCHACAARERVLNEERKRVENPAAYQPKPGHTPDQAATIDEAAAALPCYYPRHDDHQNQLRCGICENCQKLIVMQNKRFEEGRKA